MSEQRLRVAFVGHVDHGKSTLIGRLLYDTGSVPPDRMEQIRLASEEQGLETEFAYLMDHLREEREQRVTIDTAQVFFGTARRDYVVIDAPGHREFLRNMLTGASQAEAAVLVVGAPEGLGEQTRRHAFLLTLLGVPRCVVAVNKMDLVGFEAGRYRVVSDAVGRFLAPIGLEGVATVPISAKLGDNVVTSSEQMPWYDGSTLLEALEGIQAVEDVARPMRFCVQDVYHFDGRRVVAGRVESGTLDAGDPVLVLPEAVATEVLSIERFRSNRTTAEAGECIALTLPENIEARRGQVLCDPAIVPATATGLAARLFWMTPEPLHCGDRLALRLSTQETACRVEAIRRRIDSSTLEVLEEDAGSLANTEVGELELALAEPVVAELHSANPPLGRLVLERGGAVAGAGIIVGLGEPP